MGTGAEEVALAAKSAEEAGTALEAATAAEAAGATTIGAEAAGAAGLGELAAGTSVGFPGVPEALSAAAPSAAASPELLGTAGLGELAPAAAEFAGGTAGLAAPGLATAGAAPAVAEFAGGTAGLSAPGAAAPGLGDALGSSALESGAADAAAVQQTGSATTGFPGVPGGPAAPYGGPPGSPASVTPVDKIAPSAFDKAMSTITKNPLQAANVGLGATSLLKQLGAPSAQKQFNAVGGPTKDVSNQLLKQFSSGQVTGADAFAIQQYAQQQKSAIDQYYAQAGLSNSSMHTQAIAEIDARAEAMRQQAVQNLLTGGLKAAGVSDPTLTAGIKAGVDQDAAAMKQMQDFIAQLAKMNTPAPTGSPG